MLKVFPSGPFETNAYVVYDSHAKEAALIDPAPESAEKILKFLKENDLNPTKILLTHSHWDHIGDVHKFDLPVYIHADDTENLEKPGSDGLPCWINIPGVKPTHLIKEGDIIPVGSLQFHVIDTPGHTPGGVCFYEPTQNLLLSGDTLFQGTIGNLSFPTARPNLMWQSLKKLAKLPPHTKVFPGHGGPTTIGAEPWLENAENYFS